MSHPGTYVNAPTLGVTGLVPGDSNTAVGFDPASNQYVVQNDTIAAQAFTAFTIGGLIQWHATTNGNPAVMGVSDSGTGTAQMYVTQSTPFAAASVASSIADGSDSAGVNGASTLAADTTYRLITTWDGATLKVFVNGVLDGSTPYSGICSLGDASSFYAAADRFDTTGNVSFDGTLDEVFFVPNHAATAGEIATLDAAWTGTGSAVNAVRALHPYIFWRLGESSGTTAEDSSSAGNLYTPPIAYDMGPINPDTEGLPRALFRHYSPHGRYLTVWKLATNPITYSLEQPWPLVSQDDQREGNLPIGNATEVTYLHCYQAPETVSDAEAARLIASGIGTVS